ncbi:MAG: M56 family metallopeptidase, partial [Candidatus Bathyarchaeota archaeon]
RESVNGYPLLSFTTLNLSGEPELKITIKGTRPVEVDVTRLSETVAQERIDQIKQDIFIVVQHFEEHTRESTLYFAWREGEELIPEKITGKENKALNRLFLETQIFLAIVFISLSIVLFMFLGIYAPILLISLQLIIVFHSNKIIARAGDWEITSANPKIHLIQYHLPTEEYEEFKKKYSRKELIQIKKEVYEQTLSDGRKIDCETAQKIFSKHGFQCREENMLAKTVNVYELVKKTAGKFRLPMPKVVVSNTMIPNAAASGPSPKRGLILITTGLLVQLEEDEVLSVLGHEFSHLKSRDPLILFGLTALEFLLRFYVILPFFPIIFSSYVFFFLYFWAVMAIIYFIAKFFEAKSDLVSAMIIGKPKSMAEALEKIGFRRLQYERSPAYRLQRWIGLEPHPPVTFRVNRLKKLEVPVQIKHPLLQSIQDVTRGLLSNF